MDLGHVQEGGLEALAPLIRSDNESLQVSLLTTSSPEADSNVPRSPIRVEWCSIRRSLDKKS